MRTYKPATFQPIVRPDWAGAMSYIPDEEKSEILVALIKYPAIECSSRFWLETIKPDLDLQFAEFKRVCEEKSRGVRERWGKISITPAKTSTTYVIVPEREKEKECESEEESKYSSSRGVIGGTQFSKEQIVAGWNAVAKYYGLATIKSVDDTRMSKFKQRFKQSGKKTVEEFFDLLKQILHDSLFLQGKKQVYDGTEWVFQDTDWSATFDFFMQQSSFTKAIEGGYDDPTMRRLKEKRKDDATKNSDMPVPSEVSAGYPA